MLLTYRISNQGFKEDLIQFLFLKNVLIIVEEESLNSHKPGCFILGASEGCLRKTFKGQRQIWEELAKDTGVEGRDSRDKESWEAMQHDGLLHWPLLCHKLQRYIVHKPRSVFTLFTGKKSMVILQGEPHLGAAQGEGSKERNYGWSSLWSRFPLVSV